MNINIWWYVILVLNILIFGILFYKIENQKLTIQNTSSDLFNIINRDQLNNKNKQTNIYKRLNQLETSIQNILRIDEVERRN